MQARIAACAGKIIDRAADFDRITRAARQRLAHVGDERARRKTGRIAGRYKRSRQRARLLALDHEGAIPGLHVHHERVETGGKFLRQDRSGNERNRFYRRRHVPDRIETPVGRREIIGLADDSAAGGAHDALHGRKIGRCAITGDGFELVDRTAGMPEAAPCNHRHIAAAGRNHGREHEADDIADAAGRMLVQHGAGQTERAPVEPGTGRGHCGGEIGAFARVHAAKEHGHGEGRRLLGADGAGNETLNQEIDFGTFEGMSVALAADDFRREQPGHQAGVSSRVFGNARSRRRMPMAVACACLIV